MAEGRIGSAFPVEGADVVDGDSIGDVESLGSATVDDEDTSCAWATAAYPDAPWSVPVKTLVVDGATVGLVLVKEADDIKDGATVVGGVKNEPSSSVSKKSLSVILASCLHINGLDALIGKYVP